MTKWNTHKPGHWHSPKQWLNRLPVLLLALGSITLLFQMLSLPKNPTLRRDPTDTMNADFVDSLNKPTTEWEVSEEDLLHLSLLHESCVTDTNATLSWQYGSPGHQGPNGKATNPQEVIQADDPNLLTKLRQCPDVDIFLPVGLHGNGYCEDAVAYAKYLNSRLLPLWALEIKLYDPEVGHEVDYYDLCPTTPLIFFNHYWDGVPSSPRWPENKPVYLMPNIEMIELTPEHYWKTDVVLCKTEVCYDRVTRWYKEEGNTRNAKVFYTKHTSSDQAQFARKRLGDDAIEPQDFSDISFVHTPGSSIWKGTKQLLDCWTSTRGLPPLDIYMKESSYNFLMKLMNGDYGKWFGGIARDRQPPFRHDGSTFLQQTHRGGSFPHVSEYERGVWALYQSSACSRCVTTDAPPVNELISSSKMGVLVPTRIEKDDRMMLGGNYSEKHGLKNVDGLLVAVTGDDICESVKRLVSSTTTEQRAAMGANARAQYHKDTQVLRSRNVRIAEICNKKLLTETVMIQQYYCQ